MNKTLKKVLKTILIILLVLVAAVILFYRVSDHHGVQAEGYRVSGH